MTPEEREAILEREKRKFRQLKVVVAAVLIPLVVGYLLLRVQVSSQQLTGVMESVSVKHKPTGTEVLAQVKLERGDMAEVLLPQTIQFEEGRKLQVTESTSILGKRTYIYPRAL